VGLFVDSILNEEQFTKLGGTTLEAGNYVAFATVQADANDIVDSDHNGHLVCELRHGAAFIGGTASDIPEAITGSSDGFVSVSFNGGAAIGAGGGEISVWCKMNQVDSLFSVAGQMVVLKVGGFF
jgi:hypothetical protein